MNKLVLPEKGYVVLGNGNVVAYEPPQRVSLLPDSVLALSEGDAVLFMWGPTAWMAVRRDPPDEQSLLWDDARMGAWREALAKA